MEPREIKEAIDALSPEQRRELLAWMKKQKRVRVPPTLPRALAGMLIGLILFALIEGAIFHSGWYNKYLEPNSMAGRVEYHLFWLRRIGPPPKVPDVLVVGDSRIAEGFSPPVGSAAVGGQVHFVNFGMPGATPRVWYYALRDADKDRNRFSAIVIAIDRYSDLDNNEPQNFTTDFNFLAGRLRWSDCPGFSLSFSSPVVGLGVLEECLIRGLALRPDVLEFLSNIPDRLKRTKDWRNNGPVYVEGYPGKPEEMTGLTFDAATRTIHFPPGLKDWQISSARGTLTPYTWAQTGALTAYREDGSAGFWIFIRIRHAHYFFTASQRAAAPSGAAGAGAIHRFREGPSAADSPARGYVPRSGTARVVRRWSASESHRTAVFSVDLAQRRGADCGGALSDALHDAEFRSVSGGGTGPVLHPAASAAPLSAAGRQPVLLYGVEREVRGADSGPDHHRLFRRALDHPQAKARSGAWL